MARKHVKTATRGGVPVPDVTTGPEDKVKARIAKRTVAAGGFGLDKGRTAGMMLDTAQQSSTHRSGFSMDTYRSSYAYGLGDRSGVADIPTYFVQMNEQNGGLLYWPATLREKYSWYRYFARSDAFIGRALELLADLPMSKLTLHMPKAKGKLTPALREEISEFFQWQFEVLDAFNLCQSILWEWNMIGNVYLFHEWDEKKKMWSRAVMLPPEEVGVFQYPFSENKRVEYKPERLIKLIEDAGHTIRNTEGHSELPGGDCSRSDMTSKIIENVPDELIKMVQDEGCIVMDTDPMSGSFVHHIARRRSPYMDLGASVLERVLVPMLQKEHFRYTQLSLASRNMTPKNLITAPGLLPNELDNLRAQVDLSYMDPEYSIITNYETTWEQIGAQDRLLDLDREYERIERQIFAGLGVTRELLTGEGAFSGSKITVDILNSMFLLTREVISNYIERSLFIPICEAHGWYEEGKNGVKHYWYPKVGFNRLTIRDNAEVFDSLFQLYQKGSLPVDIIYELFNLDSDEIGEKLQEDLFTVKDANFNRIIEEISGESGRNLVENTNVSEKIAKYLKLDYTAPPPEDEGGGFGGGDEGGGSFGGEEGGGFGGDTFGNFGGEESGEGDAGGETGGGDASGGDGLSDEEKTAVADGIAEAMPPDATEEDIAKVTDAVAEKM